MAERFGKYELYRKIGHGGMADVWAARCETKSGHMACALKVIRPMGEQHVAHRALFLKEGELAIKLRHGNIVPVFDVGEHDGCLYMAMELIDGVSLARFLEVIRARSPGHPNLDEAIYVIRHVLRALHYVHSFSIDDVNQRIVHRDVSPQNVMVTSCGEIVLGDFGVARMINGQTTNRIYGKLGYMSREQYMGDPVQQSDLFAAGVMFYEMLSGSRLRPERANQAELHALIMRGVLPPLPRGLPSMVREVLEGLLAADPAIRMQSARDALRLLGDYRQRGDIDLDVEDLYLSCVGSRHSWYTELTQQAESMAEATTQRQARQSEREERRRRRQRKRDRTVRTERKGDDAEAPARGRSWEPAQEHDAAIDEVTTARWVRPARPSEVPEVWP